MHLKTSSIQTICAVGLFTAVMAVAAQMSIPMPYGVPLTLQTLAVSLAGVVLGAKKGALAALVYVLIGTVGLPVFAGFNGGLGAVTGPTGGFILSFPLMALAAGLGASRNRHSLWLWAGLVAGTLINYACGVLYFSLTVPGGIVNAVAVCVLPFIPTDMVKIVVAGLLGGKLRDRVGKGVEVGGESPSGTECRRD